TPHEQYPSTPQDQLRPVVGRLRPPGEAQAAAEAPGAPAPGGPQPPRQIRREAQGPPLPQRTSERSTPTGAHPTPSERTGPAAYPEPQPAPLARPELPRRTNQENLVPQLRQAPVRRVPDEHAVHDPGLVAAFRRGIDLAEARSAQDAEPPAGGAPLPPAPGTSPRAAGQGLPPGTGVTPVPGVAAPPGVTAPGFAPYAVPAAPPVRRVTPLPVRAPAAPSERGVPGRPGPRSENPGPRSENPDPRHENPDPRHENPDPRHENTYKE
ncbi:hypothetical protein ACWD3D_23160, partial [Streptomyces sp. NPDC002690]